MSWNILGHEWAAEMLTQHILRGQVRHAYLMTGPDGTGRRSLALRFAQALNCKQPPAQGEFCGICRTCQQIERMQHADLAILTPEEDSRTIKVEQVRELQHSLSLSPYEGGWRVALLPDFQQATDSAQNALLKTLEEAPPKVILLLTADVAENLLPTILSRCELLRLRPLVIDVLARALHERWQVPEEQAKLLAHLSGGRPGIAIGLNNDADAFERRSGWIDDVFLLLENNRRERFAYAKEISADKERLPNVFEVWLTLWRDVLLAVSGSHAPLVNQDRQAEVAQLAQRYDLVTVRERISALEQAISQLDANLNARLLTENLLLDWPMVNPQHSSPAQGRQ
jgi:DNA polymerase-3 subunit delta'